MRITLAVGLLGVLLVGCDGAAAPAVPSSASSTVQPIATSAASPTSAAVSSSPPTSDIQATATPTPKPRPTPAVPPPPTGVRIERHGCSTGPYPDGTLPGKCTVTVTWTKVMTKGTEIRVYGVTGCLSMSDEGLDGSCLVLHTPLPPSMRKLIARAPASKGAISWTRPAWQDVIVADTGGPDLRQAVRPMDGTNPFFENQPGEPFPGDSFCL